MRKRWNSSSKPQADVCRHAIINPARSRVTWPTQSLTQTLASFVWKVCLVTCDTLSPGRNDVSHNKLSSMRLRVVIMALWRFHAFTTHSHTCMMKRSHDSGTHWLPSHTLTTYCLASKAYVGRPRVLFISSLWQMRERGDCCCSGHQRGYSFVNEKTALISLSSYTVHVFIWLPKHIGFLPVLPNSTHIHTQHIHSDCGWITQLICTTEQFPAGTDAPLLSRETPPPVQIPWSLMWRCAFLPGVESYDLTAAITTEYI